MVSCVVNTRHTPARPPKHNPPGPTPRPLFPMLFVFPSLFEHRNPPKSNHSPTYAAFSRNSFVSPTYAKTGGWGVCFRYPFSNVPKICRRADILISARLGRRPLQRQEKRKNQPEGWPLQRIGRVTRSGGSGRRGCGWWTGARWIAAGACGERGDRAARRGHGRRRCVGWDP